MSFYEPSELEEEQKKLKKKASKRIKTITIIAGLSLVGVILGFTLILNKGEEGKSSTVAEVSATQTPRPTVTELPTATPLEKTPEPMETITPQATENTEKPLGKPIRYDATYEKKIKKALKPYSYMEIQTVEETADINNKGYTTRAGALGMCTYKFDTIHQRMLAFINIYRPNKSVLEKELYKVEADYKKNLFFTKQGSDSWKRLKKHGIRLAGYEPGFSVYGIYSLTVQGIDTKKLKGHTSENIDTFIYTRKANEDDLQGDEYSEYKAFTLQVEIKYDSKKHIPLSVTKSVTYGIEEETDVLTSIVYFKTFSNKVIKVENRSKGKK